MRSLLYAEALLSIDWQGRVTARLAAEVPEWEDHGLALRVRLRPKVLFHDGTPVTASVIKEILQPQIRNHQVTGFEAVKAIETPDENTLVFRLARRDAFLTSALANATIVDDKKPNIGTGPFRIVATTPQLVADRNTSYYLGSPGISRIIVIPYSTPRAAWAGLLKGDVGMALEISRESVEFASAFEIYSSPQPYYIPLVFNVRHPILSRVEVRRAIAEAINRDEIVNQGMRKRGLPAEDPIWPYHWAYNAAARPPAYNPNAARVRLDAAGLPVRPQAAGQRASRFQLQCMFFDGDPQFERIALLLQRQLAAVGIDLMLEGVGYTEAADRLKTGKFESYLFQHHGGREFSWTYLFWHSPRGAIGGVVQDTGYSGVDTALDRLREASTEDDIRIAVSNLRQRFYEDVPAVFLAWTETTRAVDVRFDIGDRSEPDILASLWRWRLAGPTQAARR